MKIAGSYFQLKQKSQIQLDPAFFVIAKPHIDVSTHRVSLGYGSKLHALGDAAVANQVCSSDEAGARVETGSDLFIAILPSLNESLCFRAIPQEV